MPYTPHDQARVEGDAFVKKYWEESYFTYNAYRVGGSPIDASVPAQKANSGGFAKTIYQWPSGQFTPDTRTFMLNSAMAAIENEASALTHERRKWADDSVVLARREAARAQAVRLLDEVARFPAAS